MKRDRVTHVSDPAGPEYPAVAQSAPRPSVARCGFIWRTLQCFCDLVARNYFDYKTRGELFVPKTGGALIVSNHQSHLDPVLVSIRLNRPLSYMAKKELFKNPILSWVIRSLNAFPIDRGRGDVGAMKQSIEILKNGGMLNVFPEGTRSKDGQLRPLQSGVALLIRRAKVPVIPAIIYGSFRTWNNLPRPGHIRVLYGPPMDLSDLDSKEIVAALDKILHEMFARCEQWDEELKGARDGV